MTQDFAKQPKSPPEEKKSVSKFSVFAGGFISGAFVMFLGTLWFYLPASNTENPAREKPQASTQAIDNNDDIQWDFYEIFPKSVVPIVEEYNADGEKVAVTPHAWVLQAGSFQDPDDADEQRASLILLGLDVTISKIEVSGKTWHRVIVGPFESTLARNRAQDKLAQAEVQSLAIKIPR